ncbi:MAG: hypothetical protein AAF726_14145 [Planctomycetota bacterium]
MRIREAARTDRGRDFTSLSHHVDEPRRLRDPFQRTSRRAAAGIDGVTWLEHGLQLEESLTDLSQRLRRGAFRAKAVKRAWMPKPDGRKRPIGVPVLEDKIVQRSVAEVLSAIDETGFKGFFDAIDHDLLLDLVGRRIGDPRVQRQLRKWLHAGVMEDGKVEHVDQGTPQGGSITPSSRTSTCTMYSTFGLTPGDGTPVAQ